MNPDRLAVKTLTAIENVMVADQGASYRGWLGKVIPHIQDAYRSEPEEFRSHLGASAVGQQCGRAIWYSFRWATKAKFSSRMLRLFNRGHLEEARFIALLLTIGVQVWQQDDQGRQFKISSAYGHYGGSGDGVGVGIPDLLSTEPALLEFKTHKDDSFKLLLKDGLRSSKFEHYVQMQQYMRKMSLAVGLYMAVNKNTDEIYACIVPLDVENADTFTERGEKIIWMDRAPSRIGSPPSPGNYSCRFCDHKPVCFLKVPAARNCRTCAFSAPSIAGDAAWVCNNTVLAPIEPMNLPKALQLTGCELYVRHQDM